MASQQHRKIRAAVALFLAALVLASPAVAYRPEAAGYTPGIAAGTPREATATEAAVGTPTATSSPAEATATPREATAIEAAVCTPTSASSPAEATATAREATATEAAVCTPTSARSPAEATATHTEVAVCPPTTANTPAVAGVPVAAGAAASTPAEATSTRQVPDVKIDASRSAAQKIPQTLFGLFFEEINHAGAGGLWAELVSNRGFEAGGSLTPSTIEPWLILGSSSTIRVSTEKTSCFSKNPMALKMEIICEECPSSGVGICNPGFWGMNVEQGKSYNLAMYLRSLDYFNFTASLTCSNGSQIIASASILHTSLSNWTKVEMQLLAQGTCRSSRLELTSLKKGTIWLDQVSLVPSDTHKGHGFRKELISMLLDLRPRFLRFPGGCFVEGDWLKNAFRWKETIGPWEERPGHFGDVWNYWTDDGLGYYELLQLAEDLGATPIWVVNIGISHNDKVNITDIAPLVEVILLSCSRMYWISLEFARGSVESKWGSVRFSMGHPEPFLVKYVALGNEDCVFNFYREHYLKFYTAIREAYPDIQMISNCNGISLRLDHPAELYDFHIYENATTVFHSKNIFDSATRTGPKAFVSEYAVAEQKPGDGGNGTLVASLAEAAFLTGLEKNSDVVQMASYAPIFVNDNDRRWMPDMIVFNSWQEYGTPSYWMQTFFRESSGSLIHPVTVNSRYSQQLAASAITWQDNKISFLRIKIVNFGPIAVNLTISASGLEASVNSARSTVTVLTSSNPLDENSFSQPKKVVPVISELPNAAEEMKVLLAPYSFCSFDLALEV